MRFDVRFMGCDGDFKRFWGDFPPFCGDLSSLWDFGWIFMVFVVVRRFFDGDLMGMNGI